jgi:hypothetical protein
VSTWCPAVGETVSTVSPISIAQLMLALAAQAVTARQDPVLGPAWLTY